jgi:hypothetical protein
LVFTYAPKKLFPALALIILATCQLVKNNQQRLVTAEGSAITVQNLVNFHLPAQHPAVRPRRSTLAPRKSSTYIRSVSQVWQPGDCPE